MDVDTDSIPSVQRYASPLSSDNDLGFQFQLSNIPAVFHGYIKHWEALQRWSPIHGGLDYLQGKAGSSIVEAMFSTSAPIFYGDLRRHERIPIPFSTFIQFCKLDLQNKALGNGNSNTEQDSMLIADVPKQIYLAQVPIMNIENKDGVPLKILEEDIHKPQLLDGKEIVSINLWMNNDKTRSSTHYDPHDNLLCVVAGSKQVFLWPPSVSTILYPMPVYGEASNHSSVGLENPDLSIHPKAEFLSKFSQKVVLQEGDALFIPEGWYHQVDSDDLTIAVNFWWPSDLMAHWSKAEHMDSYCLRRVLRRMIDKEMDRMLHKIHAGCDENKMKEGLVQITTFNTEADVRTDYLKAKMSNELKPCALQAVYELVSFVHENAGQPCDSKIDDDESHLDIKCKKLKTENFEDDLFVRMICSLRATTFRHVFLEMAQTFPKTLEILILRLLTPLGAEVLTRKFDDMDKQSAEDDRRNFYQTFYGAFDDQIAAMNTILNGKELFAFQAFKNVMHGYLGAEFKRVCDDSIQEG